MIDTKLGTYYLNDQQQYSTVNQYLIPNRDQSMYKSITNNNNNPEQIKLNQALTDINREYLHASKRP